jgi:hypothetical protein
VGGLTWACRQEETAAYHYYACTGRQKYGPSVCDGERLRRDHLEQAVIAQLVSLYRDGDLVRAAVTKAAAGEAA